MPTVVHPNHNMATGRSQNYQTGVTHNYDEEEQDGDKESSIESNTVQERKKYSNPLIRMIRGIFQKKPPEVPTTMSTLTPATLQMLIPTRYKPASLEEMANDTKFSKEDVKFMYRAFKQECPNGIVDEEQFIEVYGSIFPLGDSDKYAHLVFTNIDRENTGTITFGDFMDFLSVLTNGSTYDKLQWSFQFYDLNKDGKIEKEEMIKVTESIFDLMGKGGVDFSSRQHIDHVFDTMDTNGDGLVTLEQFVDYCNNCDSVRNNMLIFCENI